MQSEWIAALIGGALIGLSATLLLLVNGRIAGISGIFFGLVKPKAGDTLWRLIFVLGIVISGVVANLVLDGAFVNTAGRSLLTTGIAGLLVGFGTRLGSGCTSGHGICGLSRMSPRSITATLTFMFFGIITATAFRLAVGG